MSERSVAGDYRPHREGGRQSASSREAEDEDDEIEHLEMMMRLRELKLKKAQRYQERTSTEDVPALGIGEIVPIRPFDRTDRTRVRSAHNTFSPGYGLRSPQTPDAPLPSPDKLVGPEGSHYRVYPARAPIAPPLNSENGWLEPSPVVTPVKDVPTSTPTELSPTAPEYTSGDHQTSPLIPRDVQPHHVGITRSHHVPRSEIVNQIPTPPATPAGSYIPWAGGVIYGDVSLNESKPISRDELLEGLSSMHKDRADLVKFGPADGSLRRSGEGGPVNYGSPADAGWSRRRPSGAEEVGWNPESSNEGEGWGNDNTDPPRADISGGDSWGVPSGRQAEGGEGYRRCGEPGHFARECPQLSTDKCYNCGHTGHMSRSCPERPRPKGACFKCGETGHINRDCPSSGVGGRGSVGLQGGWSTRSKQGWAERAVAPSSTQADGGWNTHEEPEITPAEKEHPVIANGFSATSTPTRPTPAIHPDRLRMMESQDRAGRHVRPDAGPQQSRSRRQDSKEGVRGGTPGHSQNAPDDGGWGAGSIELHSAPVHDEYGGW